MIESGFISPLNFTGAMDGGRCAYAGARPWPGERVWGASRENRKVDGCPGAGRDCQNRGTSPAKFWLSCLLEFPPLSVEAAKCFIIWRSHGSGVGFPLSKI